MKHELQTWVLGLATGRDHEGVRWLWLRREGETAPALDRRAARAEREGLIADRAVEDGWVVYRVAAAEEAMRDASERLGIDP
jgi:hypothetical protein